MNGFFLVDKKEGWTSRDVVTKISHIFHEKKVGHSGTLDPFATGLLVVSIGRATKALNFTSVESTLVTEINDALTEDIFNKAFVNW